MSFRQIFLLILVGLTILLVLSAFGEDRGRDLIDTGWNERFIWSTPSGTTEFFERCPSSDRSGKLSVPADGLSEFSLVNVGGDISVTGSDGNRIEMRHTITVFADTIEQATEYLSQCHVSEELEGDRLVVTLVEPRSRPMHIRGVFTNYEITIPHGLSVDINNQTGEVSISRYEGDVTLVNGFKPTSVRNVTGALKADVKHGPLTVEHLKGPARISAGFCSVDLMDIDGDLVFNPQHCNDAVLKGVTGSVDIVSRFSNLRISDIGGPMNLDSRHSKIAGSGISGPVTAVSEFGNVDLSLVSHAIDVRVRHANITTSEISGPIVVSVEHGNIDLPRVTNTVGAKARHGNVSIGLVKDPDATGGYSIRSQVSSGKTTSDVQLDETELVRGTTKAEGLYGSGAIPVTVHTEYGNVRLRLVN